MKPAQAELIGQDEGGFCLVAETQIDHWKQQAEEKTQADREAENEKRQRQLFDNLNTKGTK